jgi:hypothetical protein
MTAAAGRTTFLETYYAGAYWGAREESPEQCALRTSVLLTQLAPCDPFLAEWYKPTRSRKDARKFPLLPSDLPTLTDQFRRGVNRERGGPVFKDLGFSFWFDNGGGDYDNANLRIRCGGYSEGMTNNCVLGLPTLGRSPNAERVVSSSVLVGVVRGMALAMEPDWAVALSKTHRDEYEDKDNKTGPWVGWVTYLSQKRGTVPPLPAPVRIERVEDKGTLILLTPERFTVANAEHLALAKRVRELLSRAGLLSPPTR